MIRMSGVGDGQAAMAVGRGTMGAPDITIRICTVAVAHTFPVGLRSPPACLKLGRRPRRLLIFSAAAGRGRAGGGGQG
jgi:hypothetical protein